MRHLRTLNISFLACMLLAAAPNITNAGSLTGSEGDKRFPPTISGNVKDPCTKAWKGYVAARGHSAYATTPYSRVVDLYIICGTSLNAKSQEAAEAKALESCVRTREHYKVRNGGRCEIAASK
ncbi:hypothetical protein ACFWXH_03310 [Mesorhizobium sp. NPDC059054]|uniref:hypothetical protein n=1 Tax=Mesorhizobium sp. NPDC059054 TaxID=3346711 RepID=UPI0036B7844F